MGDKKETRDVTDWKPFCPRVFGTQVTSIMILKKIPNDDAD